MNKTLRKVLRIGKSSAVVIPPSTILSEFVWVEVEPDGSLRIREARVE